VCPLTNRSIGGDDSDYYGKAILDELGKQMPFLLRATKMAKPSLESRMPVLTGIGDRLASVFGDQIGWLENTVKGYVMLSVEFLKLQRDLERTGRYLLSNEREALQIAYNNADVFGDYYLPGLLLSEALWPNHYLLNQGFEHQFLPCLPNHASVLEVGVGSGYHLRELIQFDASVEYTGLDISEYAIEFAKNYAFDGVEDNLTVKFVKGNASEELPFDSESFDGLIMGEILEHIDDPAGLLERARAVLKPNGVAFITTVVFAANIDHVYMFETVNEIRDLLRGSNWEISGEWTLPVYPSDTPDMRKRPMNYGAVVKPMGA
jgi:SAM-dependent methyltransferase